MHLPHPSPAIRGRLLFLITRITAIPWLRRLVVRKLVADTRIRELPEAW